MNNNPRCLYLESLNAFINESDDSIFGKLYNGYHGEILTTSRDAWRDEIIIMKDLLQKYSGENGFVGSLYRLL